MRRPPRVGIVGARRARQGLGPFVAKWLARHGAVVAAHAGTSSATLESAQIALRSVAGVDPAGHVGVARMLAAEDLDAVAILSPPEHHGEALAACLAAGVHVLCEKPLLVPPESDAEAAAAVAAALRFEREFAARGLLLWENCQWPRTLPTFRALFPGAADVPRTIEMGLEPASPGRSMVIDALSHPLSVAQALLGPALVTTDVRRTLDARDTSGEPTHQVLEFRATGPRGAADVRVELRHNPVQPRRAWLALDGHHAERTVRISDYSMELADRSAQATMPRSVPLPDPLELHLAHFVRALAGAERDTDDARVAAACTARMRGLCATVAAASRARAPHRP